MDEDKGGKKRFPCKICSKTFGRKDNVKRHIQLKHKDQDIEADEVPGATACFYPDCSLKFYHTTKLLKHIHEHHEMIFETEDLSFSTHGEFLNWKQKEETGKFVYFSKSNGPRHGKIASYEYYKCQRDGSSRSHKKAGEPNRRTKRRNSKGVAKTDLVCPARLQVRRDSSGGIFVRYFKTHSHPVTLEDTIHRPISSALKEEVKYRTLLGFSAEEIQRDLRDGVWNRRTCKSGTISKERQMVSKRFIDSVRRTMQVTRVKGNEKDCLLDRRIFSLQREKYNPILFYKPSGGVIITSVSTQDLPVLPSASFAVGLQSEHQRDLLQTCGTHLLYIDRNHCHSVGHVIVLVLMTIDEYENGFIIGSLLTDDLSVDVVSTFFKCIQKSSEKKLQFNTVLSCDDQIIVDAFQSTFEGNVNVLPCKWHLFKKWLKIICDEFGSYEDRREAVSVLVSAVTDFTPEEHQSIISKVLSAWSLSHSRFVQFCVEQWFPQCLHLSKFRRTYSVADYYTSSFLQTFHSRVKPPPCTADERKQVDALLTLLLSMEDNDYSRRQQLFSTVDHQLGPAQSKHELSLKIPDSSVWSVSDGRWFLQSDSKRPQPYLVTNNIDYCEADDCFANCMLAPCHFLCSHMYLCTCADSSSLCEHIHKVHSTRFKAFRSQAVGSTDNMNRDIESNAGGDASTTGQDSLDVASPLDVSSPIEVFNSKSEGPDVVERTKRNLAKITALVENQATNTELLVHVDSVLQQLVQNFGL